jgi:putative inorganic carbon (HCO3(-)) transporter
MRGKIQFKEESFVNLIAVLLMGVTPLIMVPGATDVYYTPKLYFVYFISVISLIYLYVKKDTLIFNWIDKLLLLFIGILFISSLMGVDIQNSFIGKVTDREPFLLYLCYFINFLLLSKKFKLSKNFIDVLLIFASIVSLYSFIQFFGINPIPLDKVRRTMEYQPFSTLGYRNAIGAYISIFLPIAIALFVYKGEKKYIFATSILFLGLISSTTRSSWVALIICVVIFFALSFKNKKMLVNLGIVLVTMLVIFFGINYLKSGAINARLLSISDDAMSLKQSGNEMAGSGRIYIWKNGINLLWDKPLLGYGVDNFSTAFLGAHRSETDFMVKSLGGVVTKAHNEYLQILICNGIFAFLLYLGILATVVLKAGGRAVKESNIQLIAITVGIVSYCVQAFFNISIVSVAPVFWAMLGIGWGVAMQAEYDFGLAKIAILKRVKTLEPIKIFTFLIMGFIPFVIIPSSYDRFYEPKILLVYVVVMVTMMFVYDREKWSKNTIIDYLIAGFIVWLLISTVFSVYVPISITGRETRREGFVAIVFYCLIFLIMYKHFKYSNKIFKSINIFICIIAAYGVVQYLGLDFIPHDAIRKNWTNHAYSTIGNRNFFATLMTLYLPINISYYLRTKEKKYLLTSSIIFSGLVASITRSNFVSFGLYSIVILWYCFKNKEYMKRYLIALGIFAVIFIMLNSLTNSTVLSRFSSIGIDITKISSKDNDTVGSSRLYIWKRGITFIPEHPILGSGPDTFGVIFLQKYFDELEYMQRITGGIVDKAHNEYLQLTVTSGIPALIIYLSLITLVTLRLIKKFRETTNNYQLLYLGLLMSIVGYLVQALFNISVVSVAPVFWAMLGIAANIGENNETKIDESEIIGENL